MGQSRGTGPPGAVQMTPTRRKPRRKRRYPASKSGLALYKRGYSAGYEAGHFHGSMTKKDVRREVRRTRRLNRPIRSYRSALTGRFRRRRR